MAGHPTGGAVDLTLVDSVGNEMNMGNTIADYANPEVIKTFANTNREQMDNLHDAHTDNTSSIQLSYEKAIQGIDKGGSIQS